MPDYLGLAYNVGLLYIHTMITEIAMNLNYSASWNYPTISHWRDWKRHEIHLRTIRYL